MARNASDRPIIFGWCNDNLHSKCWRTYRTVYTNEVRQCECPCHAEEE